MKKTLFCCLIFFLPGIIFSQSQRLNQGTGFLAGFSYALQWPGGDLADRFGQHFSAGLSTEWQTDKNNWIIGLDGHFIFGNQVRTDVLAGLRTPEGLIYGNDKSPADIQLRQRGFYAGAKLGKLVLSSRQEPRSGLKVSLGVGFLQHKIRIQDDPSRAVPQLSQEYKKGYDRLTNGWALTQFIGYQKLANDRRLNFFFGLESMQAFTAGRRDFNFDTQSADNAARFDLSFGFRVGWVLPFYYGKGQDEISY
jgi:hypothetical protein